MKETKQTLDGYNSAVDNTEFFNSNYGRRVWTQTASQVTDEQLETAARLRAELIEQTRKDLE